MLKDKNQSISKFGKATSSTQVQDAFRVHKTLKFTSVTQGVGQDGTGGRKRKGKENGQPEKAVKL